VQKFTPADEQLNKMLPHIHFEICQVTETLWADTSIRNDSSGSSCQSQVNHALWESCLIHVRILLDFFEFEKRRVRYDREMDDVLSLDYGFSAQKVEIASYYRDRVSKDLAHLTYSRADRIPNESVLPITRIFLPLLQRCALFCEHILSSHLADQPPKYSLAWEILLERINSLVELIDRNTNQ